MQLCVGGAAQGDPPGLARNGVQRGPPLLPFPVGCCNSAACRCGRLPDPVPLLCLAPARCRTAEKTGGTMSSSPRPAAPCTGSRVSATTGEILLLLSPLARLSACPPASRPACLFACTMMGATVRQACIANNSMHASSIPELLTCSGLRAAWHPVCKNRLPRKRARQHSVELC